MMAKSIIYISLLCIVLSRGAAQERGEVRSFRFQDSELRAALDSLLQWYAVPLIYLEKDVEGKRVTTECVDCTFGDALRAVTRDQGLEWKTVGGQVLLRPVPDRDIPGTLAGRARDSLTGEAVVGADVLLFDHLDPSKVYRWTSANQFGFFSLRNVSPGEYLVQVRRLGYQPVIEKVIVSSGSTMHDIALLERGLVHPEITVEGARSGFSAVEGISRGVYIRSTPSDYNQYLLEGARIYNPLHYGGVLSTFSGDALRDVQVIAGGVPPYYGGRIGGVLDVALREGSAKGLTGIAGAGSLSSNLSIEGPLFKETTFLLSGRQAYPDLFFPRLRPGTRPSDLHSIEATAKITHHLSADQQLSLSAYVGRDTYSNRIAGEAGDLANAIRWGNAAANVRWMGVASPSLFFYASAIYTRYGFNAGHRLTEVGGSQPEAFDSDYFIEDAAVRGHAEYFYDQFHTVLAGVELVRHRMGGKIDEFSSQLAPMSFDGFTPLELAVYFQDQWRLAPSVLAEMGVRATSFVAKQGSFSAVDPRFSLLVSLSNDFRLFTSVSAVNQFVHPYRNSGIFLFYPSIFLYPSTENMRPSTSLHMSLGGEKTFAEERYRLAVESYYRTTQKLHEFVYDTTMSTGFADALILGEGEVYGAEVTLDKRAGPVTGSIRYGISWASNRFAQLNDGNAFRPRFDRRHEIQAAFSYVPRENWEIGCSCLLSANQLLSSASDEAQAASARLDFGPASGVAARYAEPFDLNGGRLPGFQRIEFRVLHTFFWWDVQLQAAFRLLNGYGMVDPFMWQLRQTSPGPVDNRLRWKVTLDAPPLFPLYPVLSLNVRF